MISNEKYTVEVPEANILDETIQNKDGHIFRIFIKEDGDTNQPKVTQKQTHGQGSITTIVFDTGRVDSDFLIVGNYLCWIEPDSYDVYVLDTRPILNSSDANASNALRLAFDMRKINNDDRKKDTAAHLMSLDACSLNYAIHAQPSQELTVEHFEAMKQHM